MLIPSPDNKLVAVSYTGDTFVHLVDAETKSIVACLDATNPATGVEGGTIHTGAWYGDNEFLMCDMTGSVNGVGGGAIQARSRSASRGRRISAWGSGTIARGPDGISPRE